jgi:hypothetical protein
MTAEELAEILDDHWLWIRTEGARGTRANLAGATLAEAVGIRWGVVGPVGQGRRMLTAWAHDSLDEPMIGGGCFMGTFGEFRDLIAGVPWSWGEGSVEDQARWRHECSVAADLLWLAVTK